MANTLKFGNENWATKKDSILAYNDENANFKPLPFVTSRASTATRVNKAGLLETVGVGIPRVDYLGNTKGAYLLEPQSTNLIAQSEAFGNYYWTKSGASIEGDANTAGAEKVVNGDFATDSDWTKSADVTINNGVCNFNSGGSVKYILSNLQPLSIGKIYIVSYEIKTIVSGSIRFYSGVTADKSPYNSSVGVYSQYFTPLGEYNGFVSFDSFVGSIDNVSVKEVQGFASPSADSPLGAFKLVRDNVTSQSYISRNTTVVATNVYTYSVLAKKGEVNFIALVGLNPLTISYFDLSNGTALGSTATSSSIKDYGNGWYRCSTTFTADTTTKFCGVYLSLNGTSLAATSILNGDGVYIFGAQLEQKSYPTSYIPTNGSTVTRLADTASQTVPDGIIGQTEGTVYAEVNLSSIESMGVYCGWKIDGTSGNQLAFIMYPNGRIQATVFDGGSIVVNINDNNYGLTSGKHKIAFAYKQNDYILYVDGSVVGSDTSAAVPIVNDFDISYTNGGSLKYNQTKLYNTRLSNSELAKLTTI